MHANVLLLHRHACVHTCIQMSMHKEALFDPGADGQKKENTLATHRKLGSRAASCSRTEFNQALTCW